MLEVVGVFRRQDRAGGLDLKKMMKMNSQIDSLPPFGIKNANLLETGREVLGVLVPKIDWFSC